MKIGQIVILVLVFILGMLLLNGVQNVCGGDVIEGYERFEDLTRGYTGSSPDWNTVFSTPGITCTGETNWSESYTSSETLSCSENWNTDEIKSALIDDIVNDGWFDDACSVEEVCCPTESGEAMTANDLTGNSDDVNNCKSWFAEQGICTSVVDLKTAWCGTPTAVPGCTDETACNYDSTSTENDRSCTYATQHYDCAGNCLNDSDGDGVCDELEIRGCTVPTACNYNADVTDVDDGSCINPCLNGGSCVSESGTNYSCNCLDGYTGTNCDLIQCTQPTEGWEGVNFASLSGESTISNFSMTANCGDGWLGTVTFTQCERPNTPYIINNNCTPDPCHGVDCGEHGSCSGGTCQCDVGYSGERCETDINECASDPCQNGGTCTDMVNGYTCDCAPGYSGTDCESSVCDEITCMNGGRCSVVDGSARCDCVDGFTGDICQNAPDPCMYPRTIDCGTHGICSGGACVCAGGFYLDSSGNCTQCPGIPGVNPEISFNPDDGVEVSSSQNMWKRGYDNRRLLELISEDPRGPAINTSLYNCNLNEDGNTVTTEFNRNYLSLQEMAGTTSKICTSDFKMPRGGECSADDCNNFCAGERSLGTELCNFDSELQPGGITRANCIDPCNNPSPLNCNNNGTCNNQDGTCTCDLGYSGTACEVYDPCVGVDCGSHGSCNDGVCTCDLGYSGTACEVYDPCVGVDCGSYGSCNDGACTCEGGGFGDKCQYRWWRHMSGCPSPPSCSRTYQSSSFACIDSLATQAAGRRTLATIDCHELSPAPPGSGVTVLCDQATCSDEEYCDEGTCRALGQQPTLPTCGGAPVTYDNMTHLLNADNCVNNPQIYACGTGGGYYQVWRSEPGVTAGGLVVVDGGGAYDTRCCEPRSGGDGWVETPCIV